MSVVLKSFKCKVTKNVYREGTIYAGERLEELQELGYVEREEAPPEWPKHIGGGNYELSNGEKVKGKDAAIAAQSEIDASEE